MTNPTDDITFPRALTGEEEQLRRRRSLAIGLTLAGFAALFFVVSILKIGLQIAQHAS